MSILAPARRAFRRDDGASAVEFAIVASVLFVLVFGIISFGALLGQQLALNHAVREGARAAVVAGTGQSADIQALVRDSVVTVAMDPAEVAVNGGSCASLGLGEDLTVTANYTATPLLPLPIANFDAVPLSATAVFRCEW